MADNVTKICIDIYWKLEKSRVLKLAERLQTPNDLDVKLIQYQF
jgi:hypothetical protein